MRKLLILSCLSFLLLPCLSGTAVARGEPLAVESVKTFRIKHLRTYEIWEVVQVTDATIILELTDSSGSKDRVEIDRSRDPDLKVGDRVRYDKTRDILRQTVIKPDNS